MNKVKDTRPRRIKILGFHKSDACFGDERYSGRTGMFTPETQWKPGYFSGDMVYDDGSKDLCGYFYAVRYGRIPDEQPPMD